MQPPAGAQYVVSGASVSVPLVGSTAGGEMETDGEAVTLVDADAERLSEGVGDTERLSVAVCDPETAPVRVGDGVTEPDAGVVVPDAERDAVGDTVDGVADCADAQPRQSSRPNAAAAARR